MIDLAEYAFQRLRTRLVGLSDDEYAWEPVEGCWRAADWQDGVWPTPFTTLAWRLTHVINNLNDPRYATYFGLTPRGDATRQPPTSAEAALRRLDEGWTTTRSYLDDLDERTLTTTLGPVAGPWADYDRGGFVLHMLDELIHHGAEIALLRDLYRANQSLDAVIEVLLTGDRAAIDVLDPALVARVRSVHPDLLLHAVATGRNDAIDPLVERGFPTAMPDQTSALHHAAGGGNREAVDRLLAAGADPRLRDAMYGATPAEWATYFGHGELARHLTAVGE